MASRRRRRRRSYRVSNPRRRTYRRRPSANPHRRRRRRSYRQNAYFPNPRRRHRRSYRRNPPNLLGFDFRDVAYAGGAVIVAPFIERQLLGILPATITGTTAGRWGLKVGSTVLIGWGARQLIGPAASRLAMVALGANLLADAITEFAPQLRLSGLELAHPLGYYPRMSQGGPVVFANRLLRPGTYPGVYPSITAPVSKDPFAPQF